MSQKQLALLLAVLLILTLIIKTLHPAIAFTQDLGRHLKLGQIILEGKTVPKTNLFSYTYPDFPFINHHWLSEVIFFLLYSIGGINTLIILKVTLLTLSFTLALVVAKRHSSLATSALTGTLLLSVFLERTHIRPEIFSFLLFSTFLYILLKQTNHLTRPVNFLDRSSHPERARRGVASRAVEGPSLNFNSSLFILPPLLLLWVNLHIYFAAGLALVTFYVIEQVVHKRNVIFNLLLLVACYLLLVVNPNGLSGALEPLQIFKTYGYSIVENQTPFFLEKTLGTPTVLPFKISLIFAAFALVTAIRQKKIFASLSLFLFTILALKQIRNFPLYALVSIPFVSQALVEQTKRISISNKLKAKSYQLTTILLLLALLWQSYTAITTLTRTPPALGIPPRLHEPFEFFKHQKLKGPIFNNFNLAGLAIYHLYPDELLFVDNRPEAFPAEFFQTVYIPMQQNPDIFTQIDNQYHFNTIIFQHIDITPWAEQFVGLITHHPDWAIIYLDERTMILVKKATAPADQVITEQNAITKLSSLLKNDDRAALRNLLHLFVTANWLEAANYTQGRLRFL